MVLIVLAASLPPELVQLRTGGVTHSIPAPMVASVVIIKHSSLVFRACIHRCDCIVQPR